MNVMWLDADLDRAAEWHPPVYKKLILEAGQCLCSALHNAGLGEFSPYGAGYRHHPISRWAGDSRENWWQLVRYMSALHKRFYGTTFEQVQALGESAWQHWENGDAHKTVVSIATSDAAELVDFAFPSIGLTARPKCVADFCKVDSVTETYRRYFALHKQHYDWFEWDEPEWSKRIKRAEPALYRQQQFAVAAEQQQS